MNYQQKTRKILKDCKAFVDSGHFICASGHHADFYINKDALYTYPKKLDDICVMLSDLAIKSFSDFDVILAPAVAGVVLGQNIAYNIALEVNPNIRFAYADKQSANAKRTIRRGYQDIIRGKKVLLVDDIVSTGNTLISMAESVIALGGIPIGAVAICDRGQVRTIKYQRSGEQRVSELTIAPLVELDLQTFDKDDCPLCRAGRPIDTTLGEGTIKDLVLSLDKVISKPLTSLQSVSASSLSSLSDATLFGV